MPRSDSPQHSNPPNDIQSDQPSALSDDLYARMLDISPSSTVILDQSGKILVANKAFHGLWRYKDSSQTVGQDCQTLLHLEPDLERLLEGVLKSKTWQGEFTGRKKNKTLLMVEATAHLVSNGQNKADLIAINFVEAGREQLLRRALKSSEKRFLDLIENLPEEVLAHDMNGNIVLANELARKSAGYSKEEILKLNVADLDVGGLDLAEREAFWQGMEPGVPVHVFSQIKRKNGLIIDVELHLNKIELDGQQVVLIIARDITSKDRDKAFIRESEARYADIFEGVDSGIIYVNKLGTVLDVNERFTEITGILPERVLGKSSFTLAKMFLSIRQIPWIFKIIKTGLTGEQIGRFELEFNGKMLEISTRSDPQRAGVTGVITDITDRKQAENAVRESERKYRRLIEMSPFITHLLSLQKGVVFCSSGMEKTLGYTEAMISEDPFIFFKNIHSEDRPQFDKALHKAMQGHKEIVRYRARNLNGEWRWLETRLFDAHRHENDIVIESISIDISDRKKTEDELERQRWMLAEAGRMARIGAWEYEAYSEIFSVSREWQQIVGVDKANLTLEEVLQISHPDDATAMHDEFQRAINDKDEYHLTQRIIRPDTGETRWILCHAEVQMNDRGDFSGMVGAIQDITDQRQTEDALRHAQKMDAVGQLAGGVAHDFNNLLTAIIGSAELALGQIEANHPLVEDLREISFTADRAAQLTKKLLTLSRKQLPQVTPVKMNHILQDMERLLKRTLGEQILFESSYADDLWAILGDSGQMEQIMLNLAVNAVDAMPAGGTLKVTTENVTLDQMQCMLCSEFVSGDYVQLSVKDSGTGMTQEVLERIFEPFFTTKEQGKGTGLGLAMVYGIMVQHSGHLRLISQSGSGTEFQLYFPKTAEKIVDKSAQEIDPQTLYGEETILVVEDDPIVRKSAVRSLARFNYKVFSADSALDALAKISGEELKPHLIVTDVAMPKMNGREFADELKERGIYTPVLFMSGYARDHIQVSDILDHGIPFIAKPFKLLDLIKKVREILDSL